ncbi:MAG: MFS transporter [Deltaproteobacteria bacterium]|nr:MFS transporter [Deltaproteobacteria bacterium]
MSTRSERFSWCLYDFANSAFPTVIVTALYVLHFKNSVVGNDDPGYSDYLWGASNSIAAGIVFLTAPLLGAAADLAGRKRAFLAGYALMCITATGLLYFTGPGTVTMAMVLVIAAVVGFEGSLVFYNAFLPELTPIETMGRLSGKGWALGYVGGFGCLLVFFPLIDNYLIFVGPFVALWYLVFAIPTFIFVKDRSRPVRAPGSPSIIVLGAKQLFSTLREIRKYRPLVRFLLAYFFYNNAVITIIIFAVAFSSDSLAFTDKENAILVAVLNVVAAPAALLMGWTADRIGPKATIMITLVLWLIVVAGAEAAVWPGLFTPSDAKSFFWAVAALASFCIGGIQATSRSFVGQMAPEGQAGQFYGFMAFAGKGSAILGPLVFGIASDAFDSQRVAIATVGIFFLVGLVLLSRVPSLADQKKELQ